MAVHALSLSPPMNYWAGRALGEKLAATFDEALGLPLFLHPVIGLDPGRLA